MAKVSEETLVALRDFVLVTGGLILVQDKERTPKFKRTTEIVPVKVPTVVVEKIAELLGLLNLPTYDGVEALLADMVEEGIHSYLVKLIHQGLEEGLFEVGATMAEISTAYFERFKERKDDDLQEEV